MHFFLTSDPMQDKLTTRPEAGGTTRACDSNHSIHNESIEA